MIHPVTPWTATVQSDIENSEVLSDISIKGYALTLHNTGDSLWIVASNNEGHKIAFRAAFGMNSQFENVKITGVSGGIRVLASTRLGTYRTDIQLPEAEEPIFRYTTIFRADVPIMLPFWPRDIVPLTKTGDVQNTAGKVHTQQVGSRSGQIFFSITRPAAGSVFYFQNLSAISEYCEDTKTSIEETVGGNWPEIGFRLPVKEDQPLAAGKEYCLSDAFVLLSEKQPEDQLEVAEQFITHLGTVYKLLPLPVTEYRDWPDISKKSLHDLTKNQGCWTYADGHAYLNAYLCDYKTPPEIMVQLAVLSAIYEYDEWSGDKLPIVKEIMNGLPAFYDDKLGTISRWLPSKRENLDHSEEQKVPMTMDSWYLHHPLMNLAKLAIAGHKTAAKLLMDSIEYAIKVAHHFDYQWPVFYKMDTLETLKEETAPGEGGEKDVGGAYAHLMYLVYKLTKDQRYLNEAKRAIAKMEEFGLDIFYQANNTTFSAQAMLWLFKETGDEKYLRLSYLCLAGILLNVQLSESEYGNTRHFPTFFGVFPLSDAPYKAAYEELEVMMALNDYIIEAEEINAPILDSLRMLLPEFIRYSSHRLPFYYPPMLPPDILSDEIKTGELDPNLWIPIEDLYNGWDKNGQVGQEVYGAGVGFGIVPRQYRKLQDRDLLLFTDYPVINFRMSEGSVTFRVLGSADLSCRLSLIGKPALLRQAKIFVKSARDYKVVSAAKRSGHNEYAIAGQSQVKITWQ